MKDRKNEVTVMSWQGPVVIEEQEGGYAEPSLKIGDNYPLVAIEQTFEGCRNVAFDGGRGETVTLPGRWRLTLEKIIEPEDPR